MLSEHTERDLPRYGREPRFSIKHDPKSESKLARKAAEGQRLRKVKSIAGPRDDIHTGSVVCTALRKREAVLGKVKRKGMGSRWGQRTSWRYY